MAANTSPIFELTPVNFITTLSSGNTHSDGSGVIFLASGSTNGTRIDEIRFINSQVTNAADSARVGRIFISTNAGSTYNILDEVAITTNTRSNTVIGGKFILTYPNGIILAPGHYLGCTISLYAGVQDRTSVIARGGAF